MYSQSLSVLQATCVGEQQHACVDNSCQDDEDADDNGGVKWKVGNKQKTDRTGQAKRHAAENKGRQLEAVNCTASAFSSSLLYAPVI